MLAVINCRDKKTIDQSSQTFADIGAATLPSQQSLKFSSCLAAVKNPAWSRIHEKNPTTSFFCYVQFFLLEKKIIGLTF